MIKNGQKIKVTTTTTVDSNGKKTVETVEETTDSQGRTQRRVLQGDQNG